MQAYLDGITEIYVAQYRLRCKDQSYKWILSRGMVDTRSSDGQPLRMIGTHEDITAHKQLKAQLSSAKADAEKANHAKSRFLAAASHYANQAGNPALS